jgi:hypothetical protein
VRLSSDSLIVTQMICSFEIELFDGAGDRSIKLLDGREGAMSEEVTLEISPRAFDVIELGSIFREPLGGEPGALVEGRAAELAGVNRPVVEHEMDGFLQFSRPRPVEPIELLQQGDEIRAALGRAPMHDQATAGMVERSQKRQLSRLPGCRHAQVGAALGPGMRQIGMGQRFGLVLRQQHDIAGLGLQLQDFEAEAEAVDGVGVLSSEQAMTRATPAIAVFFSVLLSCDFEIETSAWRAISTCSRGSVQFARSATGAVNKAAATLSAASLFTAARPSRSPARKPSTPSSANQLRQRRTLSGVTPNAREICPLVQPFSDSTIARARSASSRRSDRDSSRSDSNCAAVATTRGCPAMTYHTSCSTVQPAYYMWHIQGNPA